ncbi:hypothetical protein HRR83_007378 [Exophiala dermatitidis]|uniref:Uncharacterized protein n=2 Tax=Exophiala dermatitidis TaxID=5970 RepID=H6C1W8_EXODN|nr:uncharacterized protein HMPREF1120_06659 [Exophiala dermatitidis NIH/UT8656]KAJ4508441.1 hypothetical protein HRR75_006262 [Exophiala dermatitidis]EHY58655.1 hypothetical protein HMPREF1120_06659 [Exophiala dermatitidis NIH/UT8656]KAJ4510352.1 hypothetical protein HRR74_006824 [Exophiala dermatitidis]KAJ4510713.1 hypothetical protein HRR73_006785 [Exophiala dermatitidis]KAJ4534960.1 hypothetical protein HRR76_006862 [Exophiala dermatitidis]
MAQRGARSDSQDPGTVRRLRSMGSGTDVLSMSAKSSRATLPHANPRPAYVSESEAEKLIYAEIERPAVILEGALQLVNGFLDQILYDILSKAHSVALSAVRSAVPIVLKQRLGHSAVRAADEELQDYLDEEEMEEVQTSVGTLDPRSEFDVDLAWKLTRLRCMVYAKLGDMEEEDEEDYLDDNELRQHIGAVKDSVRAAAAITPSAAIFLTTVLEFLGEQALCIAAQHARRRHSLNKPPNTANGTYPTSASDEDVILVEELDMSGVGKEGPLIRLWRSWKGNTRGGNSISSRPTTPIILSPSSPESPAQEWKFPSVPAISTIQEERSPSIRPSRSPAPADIPLPMTNNDVEEIEVPGLAPSPEHENDEGPTDRPTLEKRRPSSMVEMPGSFPSTVSPAAGDEQSAQRPFWTRKRSHSLPPTGSVSGTASRQQAEGATSDSSKPSVLSMLKNSEEPLVSGPTDEKSRPTSSKISTTVATLAGALSAEASKVFRRDESTYLHSDDDSRAAASSARGSVSTVEDATGPAVARRSHARSLGDGHESDREPQAHAPSSTEEIEASEESGRGFRDSDAGTPVRGNDLSTHAQTTVVAGEGSSTAGRPQMDVQDRGAFNRDSVTSNRDSGSLGTAAIFYQGTLGGDHRQRFDTSSAESLERRTATTLPKVNEEAATTTPARPNVIQERTSSLEDRAAVAQSIPTTRFPQPPSGHPSASQRRIGDTAQHRIPHYATSSFATGPEGLGIAHSPHMRNASAPIDGRQPTAGRQHIRLRSDADDQFVRTAPTDEMDRAKKSLDVLIDSDETLRITLTPKSARPTNEKFKVKSQTQELADFFKNTAPPGEEVSRPKSSRSAKGSINGFRSHSQQTSQVPLPPTITSDTTQPKDPGHESSASPSRPKKPVGEPRDPRMAKSSTRDLADYARSTGPENEMQLPKPLAPRPGTAQGVISGDQHKFDAEDGGKRPATTSGKPVNRLKFQARDARGPRTAESSDLIDFIREGPPRPPGDHRIDRNVAPFRTTMDSDDLNALAPPPEQDSKGRNSVGSAQESSVTIRSMPSSMNSRTGLLDSTNRASNKFASGAGGSAHTVSRQPVIPEADGMPQRTRRRVRDPYAIDYSDEEDDMEEMSPPQQRRGEEESLVDFLRNTAPPPGMTTQPILAAEPDSAAPEGTDAVKRSMSNSRLRDYLQSSTSSRNGVNVKSSSAARAESPHLTQVGSKMDKYRPTQPTHAAHVDRNRQKMRAEPRDATNTNGGDTSDLAAYLMNSGPPPGSETPPQKFHLTKDQPGFMRFFQRRHSVRK